MSEKQLNDEYYLVLEDSDTLKASMSYGIDRKNGSNRYYVLRYKDKVKDNEKPKNNANFHLLLETDSSGKVVSYKITHNSEMFRFEYHDSIPFYEYSFPYNE